MQADAATRRGDLVALVLFLGSALAAGAIGGFATASSVATWYAGLTKPSFNPPNAVFGPVWTTLYVLMGVAAWRVWRSGPARPQVRRALAAYGVQLGLNLPWSLLFFGLRAPLIALVEVIALWLAILATIVLFWRADRVASVLMIPYLAWVSFATVLNFEIWRLN